MATSGLVNQSVQINSAGLDEIISNERSRATVTPITLSATVGTPTTYPTTKVVCGLMVLVLLGLSQPLAQLLSLLEIF